MASDTNDGGIDVAKIWEKALTFLGLYEEVEEEEENRGGTEFIRPAARKQNVVNLHAGKSMRLMIMRPAEFSEAQAIADHIKTKRPVLVNLEETDINEARRIVDFLSGATYALDGNMQRVSQHIFVFAPSQVEVNAELQKEISERSVAAAKNDRKDRS